MSVLMICYGEFDRVFCFRYLDSWKTIWQNLRFQNIIHVNWQVPDVPSHFQHLVEGQGKNALDNEKITNNLEFSILLYLPYQQIYKWLKFLVIERKS